MKSGNLKVTVIFVLVLMVYSCSPNISSISSGVKSLLKTAYQAQSNGDWHAAKKYFRKALTQAETEDTSEDILAIINYEYGRALGVTCSFTEAEQYLLKAFALDEQNYGETYKDLTELARLRFDQEDYNNAIYYFERTLSRLDQFNAEDKAPFAYSDILLEYSQALQKSGKTSKAEDFKNKAMVIRSKHPKGYSITERTPYGKHCE